jgi:hypothetical protein
MHRLRRRRASGTAVCQNAGILAQAGPIDRDIRATLAKNRPALRARIRDGARWRKSLTRF